MSIPVSSGCRIDHAGHVAVRNQANTRAGLADRGDQIRVARPVEHEGGQLVDPDALRLGEVVEVFLRRGVEIDGAGRIAGADGDLLHIDVGRGEKRPGLRHRHHGDRARHVLGAQGRAFERIDRDIHLGAVPVSDPFADEQHRRLVALALADHDGAVDRQLVELAAHGVHGSLIGGLLVAAATEPRRGDGGALGHTHEFQGQNAFDHLAWLDGNAL